MIEQRKKAIPLGRIGTPEDVAWATAYLASDASRLCYRTSLDGGWGDSKIAEFGQQGLADLTRISIE